MEGMPLLTLEFGVDEPLFCMRFHPEKPQFLLGFATGRVSCYSYTPASSDSHCVPELMWTTKRHKGSCRAIAYDQSGEFAVSCGSEGSVKKFDSQSGKVSKKTNISRPASALCVNEEYVVVGDEAGKVTILKFDMKTHRVYDLDGIDSVSAICALDSVNKHNFAVSGDMHVFRIDARKDDVVSKSEDQEDDILCGCVASDTRSAWGMSEGVLTIWNNKGLMDQQQRIKLSKEGSVDSVLAGEQDNEAIAGTSDGWVAQVDLTSAKLVHKARHNPTDPEDEVSLLDYDFEYRLVSASMSFLRVWNPSELEQVEKEAKIASDRSLKRSKEDTKHKKNKKQKTQKKSVEPHAFADLMG